MYKIDHYLRTFKTNWEIITGFQPLSASQVSTNLIYLNCFMWLVRNNTQIYRHSIDKTEGF